MSTTNTPVVAVTPNTAGAQREVRPESASLTLVVHEVEGRPISQGSVFGFHVADDTLGAGAPGRHSVNAELPANGILRLDGLAAGTWSITVSNAGRAHATTAVGLARGERRENVFQLPRGLVLEGRIVDRHGDPVVGVGLRLVGAGDVPASAGTATDAEGRFRWIGVERGPRWLRADTLAGRASREGPVTMSDFTWTVRAGGDPLVLVQPIERTLTIHVVDASGRAVPGSELFVDRRRGCVTGGPWPLDADGRARIRHPEGHELSIHAWPPRDADGRAIGSPTEKRLVRVEEREVELVLP